MRRIKPDRVEVSTPRNIGDTEKIRVITETGGNTTAKYHDGIPDLVRRMTAVGKTIEQMAQNLSIHTSTLENWLRHRREVRQAYEEGKWEDELVMEECLRRKARGYEYEEVKYYSGTDITGRTWDKTVRTIKRVEPDTTAGIFWLKNRHPERWRDVYDNPGGTNNTQINITNTLNLDSLDPEERELVGKMAVQRIIQENDTHDVEEQ